MRKCGVAEPFGPADRCHEGCSQPSVRCERKRGHAGLHSAHVGTWNVDQWVHQWSPVVHWEYGATRFCGAMGGVMATDEADVTCQRCLHKIGIQDST